jgi:hypothetical protein
LKNVAAPTGSVLAVNTVIVDGFNSEIHDWIHGVMSRFQTIKYIRCISLKSLRTSTNTQWIRWIEDIIMPHWSHDEYKQAIQLGCIPAITIPENLTADQQTDYTERVVEERMYYAGGNARFFGTGGTDWAKHIIAYLHYGINAVDPLKDFQFTAERGSELAVNSLFSYDHEKVTKIISEYVTKQLFMKVDEKFVDWARGKFLGDPVIQGWITKLEVLMKMWKQQHFMLWRQGTDEEEVWSRAGPSRWFYDENKLPVPLASWNHYLFPQKWNYATFDGIHIGEDIVEFFHVTDVTDAATHSLSLLHVIPYVRRMNVHRVRFYFICRRFNVSTFHAPIGHGDELMTALTEIRQAKITAGLVADERLFEIRVVTYQPPPVLEGESKKKKTKRRRW